MTLKEPIQDILVDHFGVSYAGGKITADAILAAIRTHMTSPEAVERANQSFWTNQPSIMLAAILAALGEEL